MSDAISNRASHNTREQRQGPAVDKFALLVAGGVAMGVAAGLMLPRSRRGRLSPQARTVLGIAGEVGLALVMRSLDQALEQAGADEAVEAEPASGGARAAAPTPTVSWRDAASLLWRAWRKRA